MRFLSTRDVSHAAWAQPELYPMVVHVAHGTAALAKEKPLQHKRALRKVERKHQNILHAEWFQELLDAEHWDHDERQPG